MSFERRSNDAPPIPARAETLKVLRLIGERSPLLMLAGAADGYGARWVIEGQEVPPAIATYLMKEGFVAEAGATELGARRMVLTESGERFRADGLRWWDSQGFLQKLRITLLG